MKYVGYAFVGLITLIAVGAFGLWTSARLSLDDTYAHTQATAQLAILAADSPDGLVRIATERGEFRARIAGFQQNPEQPLVILLHGFPVTSAMWTDLIGPLADAGYRVVAFDQRGYTPGVRPEAISDYAVPQMVADVFAVAEAIGDERFHLVGHDWGAGVGWATVLADQSRVISWTALSIAHPAAFQAALENDPDQQSRSGYFALFQMPTVPETLFGFNDFTVLKGAYSGMSAAKIEEYINVLSEPGALSGALNWYRAMGESALMGDAPRTMDVSVPTLFIWGNQDAAVGRRGTELMADYMTGPYDIIELDAGHWLLSEKPQQSIAPIVRHIQKHNLAQSEPEGE
jgi:pimeloyl-ACP methyl ester carboxylesterase